MRKAFVFMSILILSVALIISCSKNDPGGGNVNIDCTNVSKTFATDVNPIIQTFCNQTACHDAGSSNGVGPLTNYSQISNNSAAIRSAIMAGTMPQNTTLSTSQKNTIICWIDSGAQNN
jgi:hypothetical protein